jgi:hypothetical protein
MERQSIADVLHQLRAGWSLAAPLGTAESDRAAGPCADGRI